MLGPRLNQILLGSLVLLALVRIALPYVLRPLIVSQADEALIGRISLEDLDLSLIRGGVTLHGLGVHVDELPPPGVESAPALFEAERLWVQISWLALFTKTIEVEEFELDGFEVRLDRLKDGLLLPEPTATDPPVEPEPASSEPLDWSFAADAVSLRDGRIGFRDFTVGTEPHRFDLEVRDLSARELELRVDPSGGEPGHLAVHVLVGDGSVGLVAQITQHADGPGAISKLDLANLPIDKLRVYLTMFGWSDLSGTLDASLEHHFVPGGAHTLGGVASLSQVEIRVPDLDRPALGFEKLSLSLGEIDVVKQHAAVSRVALVGARVIVDAKSIPQVRALLPGAAAPDAEVDPDEAAEPPEEKTAPWTWSVGAVRLEDATVELQGGDAPLPIGIEASLEALSSEPGSRWPVELRVAQGDGSLGVNGSLAIEPIAFDGALTIADLALAPLLSRAGVPAAALLRQGVARAALEIALAKDLRVAGSLGLAGLEVADPATANDFGITWKDLDIDVREVSLPDALGGGDPSAARKLDVKLDAVRLAQPKFRITRTSDGIVLPPLGAKPEEAAPAAEESAAPATEVSLEIADVQISGARANFGDRAVEPAFRTRIDRLDLRARGVHWPSRRVADLDLSLDGMNGAKLSAKGAIAPGGSKLSATLGALSLAQFNPYVTPTGYALSDGALSLSSSASVEGNAYRSTTDLEVADLALGGSKGEALFEQNFGIPLSVALGLLKDLDGKITLEIPVDGDREGARVGLGGIVAQALRKALMGALASPLKLLGAVAGGGSGKAAPEPVAFEAGSAELSAEGSTRTDQIAALLARTPGISLTLFGVTSEADLRVLRERALLEELEATSGVAALGQLGEIGTRRAARLFLEAKLAGEMPDELDPEQQAWLEQHVSELSLDPAAAETLANSRATALRDQLVRDYDVAERRLALGAPVSALATQGGVALGLGALTPS